MACPNCSCKETYQYDGMDGEAQDEDLERCAACRHIFHAGDHIDEDDDADRYIFDGTEQDAPRMQSDEIGSGAHAPGTPGVQGTSTSDREPS